MASGKPAAGAAAAAADGNYSRDRSHHRFATENKVYTRKSFKKNPKPSSASSKPPPTSNSTTAPPSPPSPAGATPAGAAVVADDLESLRCHTPSPPPLPPASSDDVSSSLNRRTKQTDNHHSQPLPRQMAVNGQDNCGISVNLGKQSRQARRQLRSKLAAELEQVRALLKRIQAHELQLAGTAAPAPGGPPLSAAGYTLSQLSVTDHHTPVTGKRAPEAATPTTGAVNPFRCHPNVSVTTRNMTPSEGIGKEKRTPKANQYYRNTEFLLAKDKIPSADSHGHKKSKANGGKKLSSDWSDHGRIHPAEKKLYAQAFKSCSVLLTKLLKHRHVWVFDKPVDVKGLGLHDYYTIIKHPMDLGTIKSRLAKNWYKSPHEFAEDVRLTFRNAMTYNSDGQDVHIMAKEMLQIFEDKWPAIEAELSHVSYLPVPKRPPPLDMRMLERSDSTVQPLVVEAKTKSVNHPLHVSRPPALKKPKAKDLNKRDMTFEEKQKLSNNLQNLPPEKLEMVVQIIKSKNLSLSQHEDEIEVDIDSVDVETLWELDRFVTNYKKSLSKNKRKAELAIQARQATEMNARQIMQERVQDPAAIEAQKNVAGEKYASSSLHFEGGNKRDNASRSSSSSRSSSESGSSSIGSDSDSSSGYDSDGARPRA